MTTSQTIIKLFALQTQPPGSITWLVAADYLEEHNIQPLAVAFRQGLWFDCGYDGNGFGNGYGWGDGDGDGWGNGSGTGDGHGSGYGRGSGSGYGLGNGLGNGCGTGTNCSI